MAGKFFRNNGLSIALLFIFLTFWICEACVGHRACNNDRRDHGMAPISFSQYLHTGNFIEATTENWESEFLEMAGFAWLTSILFQKGSPESNDPDQTKPKDPPVTKRSPWPVQRGGVVRAIYARSLSIAFFAMFLIAMALHAVGGAWAYNQHQTEHGQSPISIMAFVGTSEFWFQSFQNWQSEFLGIFCFVVLSIFLRQSGSPQSKPLTAPHDRNQ